MSVLVRAYRLSSRLLSLVEQTLSVLRAFHSGFWLGLLDRADLHRLDELEYRARKGRYLSDEHNLGGLREWEAAAVDAHFGNARRIVVLGAGAGREVLALARAGRRVDGFECNQEMVAVGQRLLVSRGIDASLSTMERDRCPALDGRYDAAVIGWGMYTHVQGRPVRERLLVDLARHLAPGSPVLVSFLFRHQGRRRLAITSATANALRRMLGRELVEGGDTLVSSFTHLFSEEEVRAELESAGYEVLRYSTAGYGHAVARRK